MLDSIVFAGITPDKECNWLNQSNPDFKRLMLLADRRRRPTKTDADEQAVFGFYSIGVSTNRDEWVYDFDVSSLRDKALFFADTYNEFLDTNSESYDPVIKWSEATRNHFRRRRRIIYSEANRIQTLYRPFTVKHHFADVVMNDRLTSNHYEIFGSDLVRDNTVICFSGVASTKPFSALVTDRVYSLDMLEKTQCLPLYRYTPEGERVSNITEWGLRRINDHYREEWGKDFDNIYPDGIGAEEIFAYTYAVLHDPVYRYDYLVDLLREFPRLPLYHEFDIWARMGRELLDLHVGFEAVEPYPLERVEKSHPAQPSSIKEVAGPARYVTQAQTAPVEGDPPKPRLQADKEHGIITLDDQTSLAGVPPDAWRYRLGSRSALEWVLDQYKEKKPRDPTIRERFDTYRFADHKERVIDLLQRVCAVSVKTMEIVDDMAYWEGGKLIVFGDRDKHEWGMMGLAHWFSEPNDLEMTIEEWESQ